jgi:hypothetical protein
MTIDPSAVVPLATGKDNEHNNKSDGAPFMNS